MLRKHLLMGKKKWNQVEGEGSKAKDACQLQARGQWSLRASEAFWRLTLKGNSEDAQSLPELAQGLPGCLSSCFLMEGGVSYTLCLFSCFPVDGISNF